MKLSTTKTTEIEALLAGIRAIRCLIVLRDHLHYTKRDYNKGYLQDTNVETILENLNEVVSQQIENYDLNNLEYLINLYDEINDQPET